MNRPESSYEAASLELTQFRERRMNERRTVARSSVDRRTRKADDSGSDIPTADRIPSKPTESEAQPAAK